MQPREGQAYILHPRKASDNTTHVATHTNASVRYFCRFDPTRIGRHQGVPDDQVKGSYWITPCDQYGSCYNGASLWQGGFTFQTLAEYTEKYKCGFHDPSVFLGAGI